MSRKNLETLVDIEFMELDETVSQAYFDIIIESDVDEDNEVMAVVVNYNVIDYGNGNPLADNPNDYLGGQEIEWEVDTLLTSYFDEQDVTDIESYIEKTLNDEVLKIK